MLTLTMPVWMLNQKMHRKCLISGHPPTQMIKAKTGSRSGSVDNKINFRMNTQPKKSYGKQCAQKIVLVKLITTEAISALCSYKTTKSNLSLEITINSKHKLSIRLRNRAFLVMKVTNLLGLLFLREQKPQLRQTSEATTTAETKARCRQIWQSLSKKSSKHSLMKRMIKWRTPKKFKRWSIYRATRDMSQMRTAFGKIGWIRQITATWYPRQWMI